jgi:GNAT superfamily N-acetyltransferase
MRSMRPDDIPASMDLVRTAGWNQTEADWRFMLAHGEGYGIEDDRGRLIASTIVLPYPPAVGWIGMVLVASEFRRRGLATRLVDRAIAAIRGAGRVPMLDATPDGRAVYATMGFRDLEGIGRWRSSGAAPGRREAAALSMTDQLADQGSRADADAFGSDRRQLLADLRSRPEAISLATPDGGGWLWSRAGRTATQIGPIVAEHPSEAIALCTAALDRVDGGIIIDVPDRETELTAFLRDRGFSLERKLTRMALNGDPATLGPSTRAIAGPELG